MNRSSRERVLKDDTKSTIGHYWHEARGDSLKLAATKLKQLPCSEAAENLALTMWERMSQEHYAKIQSMDFALTKDGEIRTRDVNILLEQLSETAGIGLKELQNVHSNPFEVSLLLTKYIFQIFNQTSSDDEEKRLNFLSSKLERLLATAKKLGIGEISLPPTMFANERARLAMIDRQIKGKMKLKSLHEKMEKQKTGKPERPVVIQKNLDIRKRIRRVLAIREKMRSESTIGPLSTAHSTSSSKTQLIQTGTPPIKFYFGTEPPKPPGPSITPEVYAKPLDDIDDFGKRVMSESDLSLTLSKDASVVELNQESWEELKTIVESPAKPVENRTELKNETLSKCSDHEENFANDNKPSETVQTESANKLSQVKHNSVDTFSHVKPEWEQEIKNVKPESVDKFETVEETKSIPTKVEHSRIILQCTDELYSRQFSNETVLSCPVSSNECVYGSDTGEDMVDKMIPFEVPSEGITRTVKIESYNVLVELSNCSSCKFSMQDQEQLPNILPEFGQTNLAINATAEPSVNKTTKYSEVSSSRNNSDLTDIHVNKMEPHQSEIFRKINPATSTTEHSQETIAPADNPVKTKETSRTITLSQIREESVPMLKTRLKSSSAITMKTDGQKKETSMDNPKLSLRSNSLVAIETGSHAGDKHEKDKYSTTETNERWKAVVVTETQHNSSPNPVRTIKKEGERFCETIRKRKSRPPFEVWRQPSKAVRIGPCGVCKPEPVTDEEGEEEFVSAPDLSPNMVRELETHNTLTSIGSAIIVESNSFLSVDIHSSSTKDITSSDLTGESTPPMQIECCSFILEESSSSVDIVESKPSVSYYRTPSQERGEKSKPERKRRKTTGTELTALVLLSVAIGVGGVGYFSAGPQFVTNFILPVSGKAVSIMQKAITLIKSFRLPAP